MYLYISYSMPIIAGFFAEGKSWKTYGSFRLGGLSKLFGLIVMSLTVLVIIGGHAFVVSVPATETTSFAPGLWYYSVGFCIFLVVLWFASEKERFKGPPKGDEIAKRQLAIIASEKALVGNSD
jgi:protein-S-isoprenylcysteine O-methyltransferase Ste14